MSTLDTVDGNVNVPKVKKRHIQGISHSVVSLFFMMFLTPDPPNSSSHSRCSNNNCCRARVSYRCLPLNKWLQLSKWKLVRNLLEIWILREAILCLVLIQQRSKRCSFRCYLCGFVSPLFILTVPIATVTAQSVSVITEFSGIEYCITTT